jgi:hypothetical protein
VPFLSDNRGMTMPSPPDDDPMPVAPPQPDFELCCGNGCDPCIFDLHDLEMDKYRQALRAWRARHPEAPLPAA